MYEFLRSTSKMRQSIKFSAAHTVFIVHGEKASGIAYTVGKEVNKMNEMKFETA
jgi:hypothetical protein